MSWLEKVVFGYGFCRLRAVVRSRYRTYTLPAYLQFQSPNANSQAVPYADSRAIVYAVETGFRNIVSPDDLPSVLMAYGDGIDRVFYLVAAIAAAACSLVLWGMVIRESE